VELGDTVNRANLNRKTIEIARSVQRGKFGGNPTSPLFTTKTLFFRQEDSDLPALNEFFPAWTYRGPDASIMAIATDRKTVTGSADGDYKFAVDITEAIDTKLDDLDLGSNLYFDDGIDVIDGDKIAIKTITAEPDDKAQEVEIRLLIVLDRRINEDRRLQWEGSLYEAP